MIKLVYGAKNKIVKHGDRGFFALREIIKNNFPEAPVDYSLSYLDEDKDQICLNSDEDLVNMLNSKHTKVHKVYIKQSLSQTVVLDLERSDIIQASIDNTESVVIKVEKHEEIKEETRFTKPTEVEKKVKIEEIQEVQKDEKKVQLEDMKEEAIKIKIQEFDDFEKEDESLKKKNPAEPKKEEKVSEEIKIEKTKEESKAEVKKDEVKKEEVKKEEEVKKHEDIKPKWEIKVDAAIQSQVIQLDQQKKIEPVELEIDPSKIVISSSYQFKREEKSPMKFGPSVEEMKKNVTRAKIFGTVEEIKKSPKKEVNSELLLHEVICSRCKDQFGIIGVRYQCIMCDHFNLCSKCEQEIQHEHSLVKVKKPQMSIKQDDLINKFRKEIYANPPVVPMIPPNHYVPSIDKRDSDRVIATARDAYKQGMDRANKLIEELFLKLETSHKNPYEISRPMIPEKVETIYEKAKKLQQLVEISYNQAMKFCSQFPNLNSEKIIQTYFRSKNV